MIDHVIQTLMGAIGAVGFAILFNVPRKQLPLFFIGGALDWAVYLLCVHNGCNEFLGMLFATMTAALSSEILARVVHAPVLILIVPMLIPLVPGGSLYRSMDALVRGQKADFLAHGTSAITCAGAICLGIICVTAITQTIFTIWDYARKHRRPIR